MKALVTGCAGFIGSRLCGKLLDDGLEVTGIDYLSDYYSPDLKRQNLRAFLAQRNFCFLESDLVVADIRSAVTDSDYLFHLAAQPGVRSSWRSNFGVYERNNILATQRLLEYAKDSERLKKFVFASSSSVYGQTVVDKVSEEHPTRPFSPYGVTKLAAEHLCSLYEGNYGLPVVSLRFFTVYGPAQRPDMAFSRLIRAALTGETFIVFGDGTQERDFTYVDDVVQGLLLAALTDHGKGVYNIGGGHVMSLNDVIKVVEDIMHETIPLENLPAQKGDIRRTSADISKISSDFGYRPQWDIYDGIRRQLEHAKDVFFSEPQSQSHW